MRQKEPATTRSETASATRGRQALAATSAWQLSAVELARAIRSGQLTAKQATQSALDRIADINPRLNAMVDVRADEAMAQAEAADRALAGGAPLGPLHGVPTAIKINTDLAGHATTHGVVALRDNLASADAPVVANLRRAGAIIVGQTNAPAFSVRWFTDNALHGRTLNPFDLAVSPGGSSGGAAVAVATGMVPVAQGSDIGGSLRHPALACGVVGLRPTVGRVPVYSPSAPTRILSDQLMNVLGVLGRTVADARLMLEVMSQRSALDPGWVPASLLAEAPAHRVRVALFKAHPSYQADASVTAALDQAARWLAAAGHAVEEVAPPRFEEAASLWRHLLFNEMRREGMAALEAMGDESVKASMRFFLAGTPDWSRDDLLEGLARREDLRRAWSVFLDDYPILLMPNSWEKALPVDDDTRSRLRMEAIHRAQSPLTTVALLGLPALSVPVNITDGLPTGVQIVTAGFREDLAFAVGETIEQASQFNALQHLPAWPQGGAGLSADIATPD